MKGTQLYSVGPVTAIHPRRAGTQEGEASEDQQPSPAIAGKGTKPTETMREREREREGEREREREDWPCTLSPELFFLLNSEAHDLVVRGN